MTADPALAALRQALDRLGEALARPVGQDDIVLDATIQRFEFCYELLWKALKRCAERYGHTPQSPRDAFRTAYAMQWIDDEALWLTMIRDRNLTSHTYKRAMALQVRERVATYHPVMVKAYDALVKATAAAP